MLLQKPITDGTVVTLKLISGEELISRYEGEDEKTVKLNRPLVLTMSPQGGIGMMPWVFLGDNETFTIKKDHIFIMVSSKKDAADQYMQGTTGIALA